MNRNILLEVWDERALRLMHWQIDLFWSSTTWTEALYALQIRPDWGSDLPEH